MDILSKFAEVQNRSTVASNDFKILMENKAEAFAKNLMVMIEFYWIVISLFTNPDAKIALPKKPVCFDDLKQHFPDGLGKKISISLINTSAYVIAALMKALNDQSLKSEHRELLQGVTITITDISFNSTDTMLIEAMSLYKSFLTENENIYKNQGKWRNNITYNFHFKANTDKVTFDAMYSDPTVLNNHLKFEQQPGWKQWW